MSSPITPVQKLINQDKKHVWHHLTQHNMFDAVDPMIVVEADGMRLKDQNGKEFLDATSGGVWTVNIGYGREEMAQTVYQQLKTMPYFAGAAGTVPGAMFAESLIQKMPGMSRIYLSNSGSEANEKAYKMIRQRSHLSGGDGKKHKIIFRDRDYHGTTIGALSSTGQSERKDQFGPFAPGFVEMPNCACYRCPFNKTYDSCDIDCANALEDIIVEQGPDTVGGVVLEPITAGGGVIVPVPEYLPRIQEICKKYDVLLHIDEVVCGLGRTGKWFGYQHFNIQPDFVTMAKGVASGYAAISVTATTEDVFQLFKPENAGKLDYFRDVSTFGGCTAGPAAALKNLEIIERENLLDNVVEQGEYLFEKLAELQEKYPKIGDVRGKGLFAGIELVEDRESKIPVAEQVCVDIAADCAAQGVLIGRTNRSFETLNNTLLLSPALICGRDEIDGIVGAIDKAMEKHLG